MAKDLFADIDEDEDDFTEEGDPEGDVEDFEDEGEDDFADEDVEDFEDEDFDDEGEDLEDDFDDDELEDDFDDDELEEEDTPSSRFRAALLECYNIDLPDNEDTESLLDMAAVAIKAVHATKNEMSADPGVTGTYSSSEEAAPMMLSTARVQRDLKKHPARLELVQRDARSLDRKRREQIALIEKEQLISPKKLSTVRKACQKARKTLSLLKGNVQKQMVDAYLEGVLDGGKVGPARRNMSTQPAPKKGTRSSQKRADEISDKMLGRTGAPGSKPKKG